MTSRRTFLRQSGAYAAAAALGPSVYASGAAAASEIEVGVLFSLTGGLSIIEQSLADATLMAIDEINKAGGVNGMMIKPILEDGASDPKTYNEKGLKKAWKAESEGLMSALCTALDRFNEKSSEALKSDFSQWIEEQGVGFGKVMMPLRLALVGALEGADVFDIIHCIGKAEAIFRIKALIDKA